MLKQRVVYTGFEGESITEDLYFNLTRMDLVELNAKYGDGDMAKHIQEIQDKKDVVALYRVLKDIILQAYGVKSEDGKRFIKNDTVREEFSESLAFAQLIEDFHETDKTMTAFITGITSQIKGLQTESAVNGVK